VARNIPELVRAASRHVRSRYFESAGWDEFQQRGDDIIISTYPKCGTTWTQRIVGMLIFQSTAPFPVQDSSPWPDFLLIPLGVTFKMAEAQEHRRFIKSHLPYDALPVRGGVKFIHVARDGRDAAMSFFNHKLNYTIEAKEQMDQLSLNHPKFGDRNPEIPSNPAQHFHDWVEGYEDHLGDPGASFFHLEKSFWEARHQPDVLLAHFNDLKADLDGEMRRIADFLDITVPDNLWPGLVKAAGFDSMKNSADELMPTAGNIWRGGGKTFLHKGTNGRWRDVYAHEDLDAYDAKVAEEFSPSLANWVEHGRLKAGDPRESSD
jgi:aryl sulfotransferase